MHVQKLIVITDINTLDFNLNVNKLLAKGFQPNSELTHFTENEKVYLCQQFVKYKEQRIRKEI